MEQMTAAEYNDWLANGGATFDRLKRAIEFGSPRHIKTELNRIEKKFIAGEITQGFVAKAKQMATPTEPSFYLPPMPEWTPYNFERASELPEAQSRLSFTMSDNHRVWLIRLWFLMVIGLALFAMGNLIATGMAG